MGYPIVITANCYNNEEEVIRFINTIERQSAVDEIYLAICVNKATNAKLISDHLDKSRLNGIVVDPENNLGYLHGCLYALERCKFDNYKWVVISNTDIEIDNIDFFKSIIETPYDRDIWCLGPDIFCPTKNSHQNPFRIDRASKDRMAFLNFVYKSRLRFETYTLLSQIKSNVKKRTSRLLESQRVYSVHGSFFLLSKDGVKCLVDNDDPIFMYGEEALVAGLVYENKKITYYDNSLKVTHNENQVTGKIGNKKKWLWFKESFAYIGNRFYNMQNEK